MSKEDLTDLKRDKQRLFYAFLVASALFILVTGLFFGLLAITESQTKSLAFVAIGTWFNNTLINVGAGIVIIVALSLMTRLFHIPDKNDDNPNVAAGVREICSDWIRDKPSHERFQRLFREADIVQVVGVTLNHTFISSKWFPEILEARIKGKKTTQFLLLSPEGEELARREKEGSGRRLKKRAEESRDQILDGLKKAGISAPDEQREFLRYYNFAPPANVLRFGDTIYVVLFMYGLGDKSPAFELSRDGWLFDNYADHFRRMWIDAECNSVALSVKTEL